jgi:hypothetical protein
MSHASDIRRGDPELAALLMLAFGLLCLRIRAASLTLRGVAATLLIRHSSRFRTGPTAGCRSSTTPPANRV